MLSTKMYTPEQVANMLQLSKNIHHRTNTDPSTQVSMKIDFRVFVDSDVIISSFLSKTGAAYLLTHSKLVAPIVSQYSMQEIKKVCTRLKISMKHTNSAFKNYRQIIIPTDLKIIRTQYKKYTLDENDAHIIAGAVV